MPRHRRVARSIARPQNMTAATYQMYKAQTEAVPHDHVRRLHASQNTNTLVSQHVRVETLVSKVAHEAVTTKRNTSNHHTRRLLASDNNTHTEPG